MPQLQPTPGSQQSWFYGRARDGAGFMAGLVMRLWPRWHCRGSSRPRTPHPAGIGVEDGSRTLPGEVRLPRAPARAAVPRLRPSPAGHLDGQRDPARPLRSVLTARMSPAVCFGAETPRHVAAVGPAAWSSA